MKKLIVIIGAFFFCANILIAQQESIPDFIWGNTSYFNLNTGESIWYDQHEIKLLLLNNQCNKIKVGSDTVVVKVSQRSLPRFVDGLKLFVADNKNISSLTVNTSAHGLLTKDALIAVCNITRPFLNDKDYVFPVSFNEGFIWRLGEEDYVFSLLQATGGKKFEACDGIDFDMRDSKGIEKHWMVAIENSKVVRLWENREDENRHEVSVLLESESQPGIFYFYGNLYRRSLAVREGQKVFQGELIGTPWGNDEWGFIHFSVIKNDTVPGIEDAGANVINFFPQLFELYFNKSYNFSKLFSKGTIEFGRKNMISGNEENNLAFEEYDGNGWVLGCWNIVNKIPFVSKGEQGNVRLYKKLFAGTKAEAVNPNDFYDYEINVKNGTYRIRAKVGDVNMETWQKVQFENVNAGEFSLERGKQDWTTERIVKVNDGKLTVRIYVDLKNKPAGLSDIVFQRAL